MRESPQDYFLNTKARFQLSLDEDDAAELYFACHNLVNHELDFDWDDTLSKMEEILKEQKVVVEPKVKYGPPKIQTVPSLPLATDTLRQPKDPNKKRRGSNIDPFVPGSGIPTSSFKHRSRIPDNTPSGKFGAMQACINNGADSPYNKLLRTHESQLRQGRFPLADAINTDAVRELLADRATSSDDRTLPDEFSLLNMFIENSRSPILYEHLKNYYSPTSEFFVNEGDKYLDKHSRNILTSALPEEKRGKNTITFDHPDQVEALKDSIGHLNPELVGQLPEEMRTRLYERRYQKWLHRYNEKFSNSPYSENGKRDLFIEHWALELDGVKESEIWKKLYNGTGEVMPGGYLGIAARSDYDELRNKEKQHGQLAIEMGLEALPFDDLVTAAQAYFQHAADFHLRDFDEGEGKDRIYLPRCRKSSRTGKTLYNYQDKLYEDHEELHPKIDLLHFADGDVFSDGRQGQGFSGRELGRFIKQMLMVNREAAANFFTGPENVANNNVQPVIHNLDAAMYKKLFNRILREAHDYRIDSSERDAGSRTKSRSSMPIYRGVRQAYPESWNDVYDIPNLSGNDMNSIEDVRKALHELVQNTIITDDEYRKALEYADADYGGHKADAFTYARRRDSNHKVLSPWIDALEGISLDDVDSSDKGEKSLKKRLENLAKMPFYHHHTRHSKRGGLGKESQDSIAIFAQRYAHEFTALEPDNFTLGDRRHIYGPKDKEYREFIAGLGELGNEIARVQEPGNEIGIAQLRNNSSYPILSEIVDKDFPIDEISEASLQSSNVAAIDTSYRDEDSRADSVDIADLIRTAVIRHTGNLLDDNNMPVSETRHMSDLRGSLRNLAFTQLEGDFSKGALGYIPSNKGFVAANATIIPESAAARMVLLQHVLPLERMVEGFEFTGDDANANEKAFHEWRKKVTERLLKNIPKSQTVDDVNAPGPVRFGHTSGGQMLQSWIVSMAKMFFSGKRDSRRIHTNHPFLTANMLLNHKKKNGINSLEDGCGLGNSQSNYDTITASYANKIIGREKAIQENQLERTFMMKLRASLWGMGGTLPLHNDGVTLLEDPQPFIDALIKSRRNPDAIQEYADHPSKFFEEKQLYNIFASMLAVRGKHGPDYPLGFSETQRFKVKPHWREVMSTNLSRVPKHALYPLVEVNGKHHLELEPQSSNVGGKTIFTPSNLLHSASTEPVNLKTLKRKQGIDPTLLDDALFFGTDEKNPVTEAIGLRRDGEDRLVSQPEIMSSKSLLPVPKDVVIQRDGKPFAVGPHPAEFAALWADHVLQPASYPHIRTPQRNQAAEELSDKAKRRAFDDLGHEYALGDENDPDIYYRSGINQGKLIQIINDESNLYHALRHSWPVIVADYALKAAKADETYSGLSLNDKISKFRHENLAIPSNLPIEQSKELSRRRAMIYRILQSGYHFMQGDNPKSRNQTIKDVINAASESGEIGSPNYLLLV